MTYRLILREKELHCHVQVVNPSRERELCFQLLLHTYLKVPDVTRCQVTGLRGCAFTDTVRKTTRHDSTRHDTDPSGEGKAQ